MINLYIRKIVNGDINLNTGMPWTIDDVPLKWRAAVREALENENGGTQ